MLKEPGSLPKNWGPIFGLAGIQDRLGDLSWLGEAYSDMGWVQLSEEEEKQLRMEKINNRINEEKATANTALGSSNITVEEKIAWLEYLTSLDLVCFCPDFDCNPQFPIPPNA